MRLIFISLTLIVLTLSSIQARKDSCLDDFHDFKPVEVNVSLTNQIEDYSSTVSLAWYGECILSGSKNGLLLYDIHQPDTSLMLAHLSRNVIGKVAVNPKNMTIAFNVAFEPIIYFINPDETISTWNAQGEIITDVSFSPDGSLMAVTSSKMDSEFGLYYDPVVEILNNSQDVVASIPSDPDRTWVMVTKSIFSADNQHLFTHDVQNGVLGDNATDWEIQTGKKVWDYNDLFRNQKFIPDTDPLYWSYFSMNGHIAAFGGLDSYMHLDEYSGTAVHLWDVNSQKRLGYIVISRRGGSDDYPLTDLTLNHDGSILVTGQSNGLVQFWNTNDGIEIPKRIQEKSAVSRLQYDSSERYLSFLADGKVVVWDTETGERVSSFDPLKSS